MKEEVKTKRVSGVRLGAAQREIKRISPVGKGGPGFTINRVGGAKPVDEGNGFGN